MLQTANEMFEQEDKGELSTLDTRLSKQFDELQDIFDKYRHVAHAGETGWQTSDISRRNRLIAEIIYKQSNLLSCGLEVTPRFPTQELDVQWDFGTKFSGKWKIPEGVTADLERTTWYPKRLKLYKYEVAFMYTWEQMIYDKEGYHMQHNLRVASDDQAEQIDNCILDEYHAHAGHNAAAVHPWDDLDSSEPNPTRDVATLKKWIFKNSNVNRQEVKQLAMLYPAECEGILEVLREINGIRSNYVDYFNALGVQLLSSRSPTLSATSHADYGTRNEGLLLVKGSMTARFFDFTGYPPVPLTQRLEQEQGHKYIIRRWFNTKCIPESQTVENNYRVTRLTGIRT